MPPAQRSAPPAARPSRTLALIARGTDASIWARFPHARTRPRRARRHRRRPVRLPQPARRRRADVARRAAHLAREELAPIVDDYWARAEFPHELIPASPNSTSWASRSTWTTVRPGVGCCPASSGWSWRASTPAFASFYGVHSGLAMGTIHHCGSDEQRAPVAAADAPAGEDRRVRADRAARRFGRRRRARDHGTPRRRRVGARRREALDRQRHVRRPGRHLGARRRRRQGEGIRRREGHARVHRARRWRTSSRCASRRTPTSTLDGVRVPEANRLQNANSFDDTNAVLRNTRGSVAWSAVGVMTGAYEVAVAVRAQTASSSAVRSAASNSSRICSRACSATSPRRWAWRCAARSCRTTGVRGRAGRAGEVVLHDPAARERRLGARADGRQRRSCSTTAWRGISTTPRRCTSYEGTREINTLIVGRAITGESAFT